jgi:predicted short-subunit dehydrogenase-like oxidoreductase (DUF2520 family)
VTIRTVRIIGPGRAGRSLARALDAAASWRVVDVLGRGDEVAGAAAGVDLVVIATPDHAIEAVAGAIHQEPQTVIAHLAGSRGLEALAPHARRAALHPLMTLADEHTGAARLRGAWFAVAGDPLILDVVSALDGSAFTVTDEHRALYHAAACVAANHLVALLAQVERLAAAAGVPFSPFFDLARAAVDNVEHLGARAALTGPAARGDRETIDRHLAAMDAAERPAYEAMVAQARRLVA